MLHTSFGGLVTDSDLVSFGAPVFKGRHYDSLIAVDNRKPPVLTLKVYLVEPQKHTSLPLESGDSLYLYTHPAPWLAIVTS